MRAPLALASGIKPKRKGRAAQLSVAAGIAAVCLAGSAHAAQDEAYGPPADTAETIVVDTPASIPGPLAAAVNQALEGSPLILVARAELGALDADLRGTKFLSYPNLTAEILATTGGSNVADADGLAVNLALEQPIWAGGSINNQVDAARYSRDVGYYSVREVQLRVLLGVTQAYFDALLAAERARVLELGLLDHRQLVASIERRVRQEVSPRVDLTLARSRLTQMEIELATARELSEEALLRMTEFVGSEVAPPVLPDETIFAGVPLEQAILPEAIACNPTLAARQSQIEVAEAQQRTARSDLFPQLLLQLSQNELTGARAAIVLRAQTGNGLVKFANIDSAKARTEQAIAQLGQADREARTQLRREYISLRSNTMRAENGAAASEAAVALLASYRRQFVAGRRSWLDVLNSVREVTQSRIAESDARVTAAGNAARILALSCRWQPVGESEY